MFNCHPAGWLFFLIDTHVASVFLFSGDIRTDLESVFLLRGSRVKPVSLFFCDGLKLFLSSSCSMMKLKCHRANFLSLTGSVRHNNLVITWKQTKRKSPTT